MPITADLKSKLRPSEPMLGSGRKPEVHIPKQPDFSTDDLAGHHGGEYVHDASPSGGEHRRYRFDTEKGARKFTAAVRKRGITPSHTSFKEGFAKHLLSFGVKNDGRGQPKREVLDTLHRELVRRGGRRVTVDHRSGEPRETGGHDSSMVTYEFHGSGKTPAADLASSAADKVMAHAELAQHIHACDLSEGNALPVQGDIRESRDPFSTLAARAINAARSHR